MLQAWTFNNSFEPNFLAVEGRTVAECIVNKRGSDVVSSIVWRHNGSIVQPVPDRIIIDTDLVNARSELEIDLLILSDAGTYTCQALFSIPTGASATGMATLRVASELNIVNRYTVQPLLADTLILVGLLEL